MERAARLGSFYSTNAHSLPRVAANNNNNKNSSQCPVNSIRESSIHHHRRRRRRRHLMQTERTPLSVWKRLQREFSPSYLFFTLEEPTNDDDDDDDDSSSTRRQPPLTIDVVQSFAPRRPFTILVRLFFLAVSLHVLYHDVSTYPPHNLYIYMGYLTHWGHVLMILYFVSSWLCSLVLIYQQPQQHQPSRLVRCTWGLYATTAPLEICITLLYWSAVHEGPLTYTTVMEHGGLAVLVLLDGLVIGLVPLRAKQFVFLLTVCVFYFVWSIVDAICDIGNGEWGPAYEDDALYPVLNWKRQSNVAAIVSAFSTLVLAPMAFFACWMLSLASCSKKCCEWDGSRRPVLTSLKSRSTQEAAFGYVLDEEMVVV